MSAPVADPAIAVSVVIPTYNRAHLLRGAMDALVAQETPPGLRWEIVIVDNNSRDATRSLVQEAAARAAMPVSYLFEPRQGKSHALNAGIAAARGEVIAFTDDDVIPAPDWVATAARTLDRWGAAGAGGRILPSWEGRPPGWLVGNVKLAHRLGIMEHEQAAALVAPVGGVPQVWGSNMVFRRSVLERLGGFDTGLGPVGRRRYLGDDSEMVDRVLLAGHRVVYDPALTVHHRVPRTRMRRTYFFRADWDRGEGEALHDRTADGPRLFGAPRWRYRYTVKCLGRWLAGMLTWPPNVLNDDMDFFAEAGRLWGYLRRKPNKQTPPAAVMSDAPRSERASR